MRRNKEIDVDIYLNIILLNNESKFVNSLLKMEFIRKTGCSAEVAVFGRSLQRERQGEGSCPEYFIGHRMLNHNLLYSLIYAQEPATPARHNCSAGTHLVSDETGGRTVPEAL